MIKINLNCTNEKLLTDFSKILSELGVSFESESDVGPDAPVFDGQQRVVLVDLMSLTTDTLDKLSDALKRDGVSVLFVTSSHEFPAHLRPQLEQWVSRYEDKIFFVCQKDDDLILRSSLKIFFSLLEKKDKNHLSDINESVTGILQKSLEELQRVKELHEKIVPMRSESIQGLSLYSKFGAGEGRGGEFFDIVKGEKECLILLTSSESYVGSSVVLSHFEHLQSEKSFSMELIEEFLTTLYQDLKVKGVFEGGDSLSLLVAKVDLNKMILEGHQFGDFKSFSNLSESYLGNELDFNPNFYEKSHFKMRLERNGRFIIFSPGSILNLREKYSRDEISDFSFDLVKKPAKTAINEVFYQMDKFKKGSFLKHDSTVLFLEVDSHVIVEV